MKNSAVANMKHFLGLIVRRLSLDCCMFFELLFSSVLTTESYFQLEFEVKQVYTDLLDSKSNRWEQCRTHAADFAEELSDFFSGSKVLCHQHCNL
jgi:hypothetical protein